MNTNTSQVDTRKVSKLRNGVAVLVRILGLAVLGSVAPATAFAAPVQSSGGHAALAHHPQSGNHDGASVVWAITAGLVVVGIGLTRYLRARHPAVLKKWARFLPYAWFVVAATSLGGVIIDVRAGKPFINDLTLVVLAAFLVGYYLKRNRRQNRGS